MRMNQSRNLKIHRSFDFAPFGFGKRAFLLSAPLRMTKGHWLERIP
jgi:hypothetical protein